MLGRRAHLAAAVVAVLVTVGLGVAAGYGRDGLLIGIAAVQFLLVPAWVLGTGMPGRIGGIVIGLGAAAAADAALIVQDRTSLAALLGVLALAFPAMLAHQLARGVVRVRVTESLSGVAMLVAAEVALSTCLALARAVDGQRLASAVVVSAGAALAVARLVDAVVPAPRFAEDVAHGLPAVLAAAGAGALAGLLYAGGQLSTGDGALLGAVVGGIAALVSVGVGYIAGTVEPRPRRAGAPALAYLGVALPLALVAPVGYLVGLSVAG
ncbi:MAG TPA: hypothetical protein VF109_04755 [Mycobacteriales bacterium]